MIMKITVIVTIISILATCNNKKELNESIDKMHKNYTKLEYKNDSLYLSYVVKEFIRNDYEDYHSVYMYGKNNYEKVNIYVNDIFYSPCKTKLIAFIILEVPNSFIDNKKSLEDPTKKYSYYGLVLLAIRDNENDNWTAYCLPVIRVANYASYETVSYKLRNFFINELKEQKGHDFNCNLNEPCFWTDTNSIWRKGDVIPGYYNFQINTNKYYYERDKDKKDLKDFLVPVLDINYPQLSTSEQSDEKASNEQE